MIHWYLALFACAVTALVFFVIGVAAVAARDLKLEDERNAAKDGARYARMDERQARAAAAAAEQRLRELEPELYPFPAQELGAK